MQLDYHFNYEVHFVPVGGNALSRRTIIEPITSVIPEFADGDAPVAARWKANRSWDVDHVRVVDGKFYAPGLHFRKAEHAGMSAEQQIALLIGAINDRKKSSKMPAAGEIKHLLGDHRDAAMNGARRQIENLAIIDGDLYSRCHAPFYRAYDPRDGRMIASVEDAPWLQGHPTAWNGMRVFGLNQRDDLEMRAADARVELRLFGDDVEVRIPEAVEMDPGVLYCAGAVSHAIHDNRSEISYWSQECVSEYVAIRDAYRLWTDAPSAPDIVDLYERVHALFTTRSIYHGESFPDFLAICDLVDENSPRIAMSFAPSPMAARG